MGCCGERAYKDNEKAELTITRFELKLPCARIKASIIVSSCQKYIKHKKIHETFLTKILNYMGTNKNSDTSYLIQNFYLKVTNSFSSQQLITLIILLAGGE